MKNMLLTLSAALGVVAFTACTSSNDRKNLIVDPPPDPLAVVYAAGTDSLGRPVVWKDGAANVLIETDGYFNSVVVSGGVLYAVGQAEGRPIYFTSSDPDRYYYLGSGYGVATSVSMTGGYVYIAGWDGAGGKVWRDSSTYLNLGADARPWSVCVSGGYVYTGGWDDYGGCVWRDDQLFDSLDDDSAYVYSIDVDGTEVYAAGEVDERPVWFKTSDPRAFYLGSGLGWGTSLRLSGGYMHVSGVDGAGGMVWRGAAGGTSTSILHNLGAYALPESIFVSGANVYTGGFDGTTVSGRVWRNASAMGSFGAGTDVYSVFVN